MMEIIRLIIAVELALLLPCAIVFIAMVVAQREKQIALNFYLASQFVDDDCDEEGLFEECPDCAGEGGGELNGQWFDCVGCGGTGYVPHHHGEEVYDQEEDDDA